jgi:hypothetical protein
MILLAQADYFHEKKIAHQTCRNKKPAPLKGGRCQGQLTHELDPHPPLFPVTNSIIMAAAENSNTNMLELPENHLSLEQTELDEDLLRMHVVLPKSRLDWVDPYSSNIEDSNILLENGPGDISGNDMDINNNEPDEDENDMASDGILDEQEQGPDLQQAFLDVLEQNTYPDDTPFHPEDAFLDYDATTMGHNLVPMEDVPKVGGK